jgi:hypothetical protein
MRNRRPPTEAAYNIRIAPNKTINPVMADPRHTLSNIAMMTLPNVLNVENIKILDSLPV